MVAVSAVAGGSWTDGARPTLLGGPNRAQRSAGPRAAVLVLHGGREASQDLTSSRQLAFLRMIDMYVGLRRAASTTAVYLLRNRLRGWNAAADADPDPVHDARWALGTIRAAVGAVPVVVLGHSMGGRTGFAIADDPQVVGAVALAPWLPDGEPLPPIRPEQSFVIAHGTSDTVTSAPASHDYAGRLRRAGARVAWFGLAGGRHALLGKPLLWHRFAVRSALGLAGDASLPAAVSAALSSQASDVTRVPMTSVMAKS